MTQFRKDLNKLLKQRDTEEHVQYYERGLMTLDEMLRYLAEMAEQDRLIRMEGDPS